MPCASYPELTRPFFQSKLPGQGTGTNTIFSHSAQMKVERDWSHTNSRRSGNGFAKGIGTAYINYDKTIPMRSFPNSHYLFDITLLSLCWFH
jgi:hypothetical protein